MFKYLNAEGRNAEFSIDSENPSILHVGGFKFEGMQIKPTDFDLSEYAGEMVRVYLDADGSYSMEHGTHEWLLFMGMVPDLKYKTVLDGLDEHGVVFLPSDDGRRRRYAENERDCWSRTPRRWRPGPPRSGSGA